jgi:hypothetical protein
MLNENFPHLLSKVFPVYLSWKLPINVSAKVLRGKTMPQNLRFPIFAPQIRLFNLTGANKKRTNSIKIRHVCVFFLFLPFKSCYFV